MTAALAFPAADATQARPEVRWRFGPFIVWETQRRIERLGEAVRLGSRSFELLLQLVKRVGEVVSKDELLSTVWAGVVVEEASVRVQMSALRKALGEPDENDDCVEWISNIPLRGYRFNGAVRREVSHPAARDAAPAEAPRAPAFTRLPVRLTRLIGREADVLRVLAALEGGRLVTMVGPGGMGKTRAAIRAAECLQAERSMQTAFVDLSTLVSPDHVLGTMARALGAPADAPDTMQTIHQRLAGRDALLLVDNCEHVVDALAPLIDGLLAALPRLRVLATSREAFRMEGEHVLRLAALAVPGTEQLTLAEAVQSPAVELLVERAQAAGSRAFEDRDAPLLARIARQVDGIPLAIELVAARLGVQSIGDLALRLNDHMRLYSVGNGAVLPRHRTLAAALDWSIALLNDAELQLLRRLSVFRGRFDVESALRIADGRMDAEAAFDALISLVNKSLVAFDNNDGVAPYRLLDTTRGYAGALLSRSGEAPALQRRHADLMHDLMGTATAQLGELGVHAWTERHAHRLDDVRAALDACLAQPDDAHAGAALTIASAPLWFHVSQIEEYRDRVRSAIACVEGRPEPDAETAAWLQVALANALFHTRGPSPEMNEACERALAGALSVDAFALELQARWGMCVLLVGRGDHVAALRQAERLAALARTTQDPTTLNLCHRIVSLTSHFSGNFAAAAHSAEAAMRTGASGVQRTRGNVFQIDARVAAHVLLARTVWIQGDAPRALEAARRAVAHARADGNAISLCFALFGACPVALWSGELALAREWIPLMLDEAQRRGFVYWHRWAQCFSLGLEAAQAEGEARERHVREVAAQLAGFAAPQKDMLVTLCADWFDDEMVTRAWSGSGQWNAAEVWRAAGRRSERRGLPGEAEAFYTKAIATARQQGATGWELRAACNLARMWHRTGRTCESVALLGELCGRAASCGGGPGLAQARALHRALCRQPGREPSAGLRRPAHPLQKGEEHLSPIPGVRMPLRSYP
ncbi:ATP-binding protein [Variovorax paradoxus]|uniref:HTH-type transcriptional regulator n=1 Tax=Variovorax paradoxus TaxID=34073 RepID=A0A679J9Q1_VARPD|nr:Putative HTH-type transcriptional regulator [Variovorax paradoxus]